MHYHTKQAAMAKHHIRIVALILLTAYYAATTSEATETAYDILAKNNLPRGILPQGVQSYVLSPSGKMDVTLPGECNFAVPLGGQQYKMRFGSKVGGIIQAGSISEAYGVRIQIKFGWLGITRIDRAGDQLKFYVQGQSPQSFPVSSFTVSPSCS